MSGFNAHILELRLREQLIGQLEYGSALDTFRLVYLVPWQASGFPLSPPLTPSA